MAVVGAHPVGRVGGASGLEADALRGGFILRVPVQRVVVAAAAVVEETSGRGEEVEGRFELVVGARKKLLAVALGQLSAPAATKQQAQPLRELVIAQAAGTFLDVGFEMEDGIAVFGVAGARHLGEVLHDGVPFAQDERREQVVFEALVERCSRRRG